MNILSRYQIGNIQFNWIQVNDLIRKWFQLDNAIQLKWIQIQVVKIQNSNNVEGKWSIQQIGFFLV